LLHFDVLTIVSFVMQRGFRSWSSMADQLVEPSASMLRKKLEIKLKED
jgi:hypothetical protein